MKKSCEFCGKELLPTKWKMSKRKESARRFCNRKCYGASLTKEEVKVHTPKTCLNCGAQLTRRYNEGIRCWNRRKFCPQGCQVGKNHPRWRGGRNLRNGYYTRIHTGTNQREFEHRIMAERALGRRLKANEVVHHINTNKEDNRNDNFLICTRGYHKWLHDEMGRRYAQEHFGPKPDASSIAMGCAC